MDEEIVKLKMSIKALEERLDYLEEYIKHKFVEGMNTDISKKSCNSIENRSIDDIYKRIIWIEQEMEIYQIMDKKGD